MITIDIEPKGNPNPTNVIHFKKFSYLLILARRH